MFSTPKFSGPKIAQILPRALAAATASAIILSASVQASPVKSVETVNGRTVRSVEVKFVDLDLTSEAGAATLERRIKSASKLVCGPAAGITLRDKMDYSACMNETLDSGKRAMVTLVARAEAGERFQPGERIAVGS